MKTLFTILNHPLTVMFSALFGSALLAYLQETAAQALMWFVPCMAVILADLASGVRAAKFKGENVRFSSAMRRTINKCICYCAWIIFCVTCNKQYNTQLCAWFGMGIVFLIEGLSFITNLLEPRGLKLSLAGVLRIIGSRLNLENLDEVVKPNDE